jgi:hypothetical protein
MLAMHLKRATTDRVAGDAVGGANGGASEWGEEEEEVGGRREVEDGSHALD